MRMEQVIGRHRMRLIALVEQAASVRAGCRLVGIHHSTYYDWVGRMRRDGIEGLTPRAGRTRVLTAARIRLEAEVVALALANPPWGPRRLFFELGRRGVGVGSVAQVWRILVAHDLNTRQYRFRVMAAARGLNQADEALGKHRSVRPVGRLMATTPGDLVQMDCFHIGSLKEARIGASKRPGVVWQYTAIDVASSFIWAQLATSAHNPSATHTSALAMRVAEDLTRRGWVWSQASTDRGNEFVASRFTQTLTSLGVTHRFIAPGRPQSNGKVEQAHNTLLQELWKPAFVNYQQPSITGLRQDLDDYLTHYNHQRPHGGKWNNGTPPANIITPNSGNTP